MPNRVFQLLVAVVVVGMIAAPASGQTYNYSADFTLTGNPSGTWSYGSLGADFSSFSAAPDTFTDIYNGCDYGFWKDEPKLNPCCGKITGSVAMDYEAGTGYEGAYLPVGGYMGSPNNAYKPDARWTSPHAARVQVTATFKGGLWTNTGSNTDVFVLKNLNKAAPIFSGQVDGFPGGGSHPVVGTNHTAAYSGEVIVNPGDTIDFCASDPGDRTIGRDQIAFEANVEVLEIFATPTLNGTVTDQLTSNPVKGAKVKVVGTSSEAVTNELGVYSLQVIAGTYSLEISAPWFQTQTVTDVVVGSEGATKDIALVRTEVTGTSWSFAGDFDFNVNPTPSANLPIWTYMQWSSDLTASSLQNAPYLLNGSWYWSTAEESFSTKIFSNLDDGEVYVPAGSGCLSPGNDGFKAGARWTSAKSATLWVQAVFKGAGYANPTFSDVHVIKNCGTTSAEELFTDTVSGFVGGGGHDPIVDHATAAWWGRVDVSFGDTIDFIAGDGGDGRIGDVVIVDGGLDIIQGSGVISGTVYNASHQPIEGALVHVLDRSEFCTTDSAGHYEIPIPIGTYTLAVTVEGVGGDQKPVTVADNQTVTLDFTLGLGTIQGVVREAEGAHRPFMGAIVKVVGHTETAITDDTGHYNLTVGAGNYSVQATAVERIPLTLPVTVTSNQTTTLNFDLSQVSSWSYFDGWSVADNPSGAWLYGSLNGDFTVFSKCNTPISASLSGCKYEFWQDTTVSGGPCWGVVLGPSAMDYPSGPGYPGAYMPVGGYAGSPNTPYSPALRWVSPVTGRVQVNTTFKGGLRTGTGSNSDVRVFKNQNAASPLFSANVQGFPGGGAYPAVGTNHTATYTGEVNVATGDTVEFVVSDPTTRSFDRDQVCFGATITVVERTPTVAVTGAVTDAATGLPISGVSVSISGDGVSKAVVTGATGRYVFYVLSGAYTVSAGGLAEYSTKSYQVEVPAAGLVRDFALSRATSWSLAGDWSSVQNPNGAWSYGRYDYYVSIFQPHTLATPYYAATIWSLPGTINTQTIGLPKGAQDIDDGTDYYPAGSVTLFPAQSTERSGVQWTAPYAATVRVSAVWSGPALTPAIGSSDVQIWKNATVENYEFLQKDNLTGFAGGGGHPSTGTYPTSVWSGVVTVVKGDTLDFSAGFPEGVMDRYATPARLDAWITVTGSEANATRLGALKSLDDGSFVSITEPKVVTVGTGTFTDGTCYIEDLDRVSGIRVVLGSGFVLTEGERVKVDGVLGTDANGERTLFVTAIQSQQTGDTIGPLGAPNKSIKATVTGASLSGLLVTGWGKVTDKSETGQIIYVDDGSAVAGQGGKTGIKVVLNDTTWPSSLQVDDKITVRGICSLNRVGGTTFPVILARTADDVTRP